MIILGSRCLKAALFVFCATLFFSAKGQNATSSAAFTVNISDITEQGTAIGLPGGRLLMLKKVDCSGSGIPIEYIQLSLSTSERENTDEEVNLMVTTMKGGEPEERALLRETVFHVTSKPIRTKELCAGSSLSQMIMLNEKGASPVFDALSIQL